MKVHIGNKPHQPAALADTTGLQRIHSPSSRRGYLAAGLVGLFILFLLLGVLIGVSVFLDYQGIGAAETAVDTSTPWGVVIFALLIFIPLHEFLHMIWYPKFGFSAQTTLVIWPQKLRFGVYYAGCVSRPRWLMMRLAPLIFLSIFPTLLLILYYFIPFPYSINVFLQLIMLVNAIGSGGDVVAAILVMRQVPSSADICFHEGKAYWRKK